jgi:hypothetical protein
LSLKKTFECGTFLPGIGPVNIPDFTWGSTIDVVDPPPPPPPPPPPLPTDTPVIRPPGSNSNTTTQITLVPITISPTQSVPINFQYQNQQGLLYFFTFSQTCQIIANTLLAQTISTNKNSVVSKINQALGTTNWTLIESITAGGLSTVGSIGSPCSVLNTSQTYLYRVAAFVPNTTPPPPPPTVYGYTLIRDPGSDEVISNFPYGQNQFGQTLFGRLYTVAFSKVCSDVTNSPTWQDQNQTYYNNQINTFIQENNLTNTILLPPTGDLDHDCQAASMEPFDYYTARIVAPVSNLGALQSGRGSGGGLIGTVDQTQPSIKSGTSNTGSGRGLTSGAGRVTNSTLSIKDTASLLNRRNISSGQGVVKHSEPDINKNLANSLTYGEIDLTDPAVAKAIVDQYPAGAQDPNAFLDIYPSEEAIVPNDVGYTELLGSNIDRNIRYILKTTSDQVIWSSKVANSITENALYRSLKPEVIKILERIRNYDGSVLSKSQVFNLIGTRIIDGTLGDLTLGMLEQLAQDSERRASITFKNSLDDRVNEVAAFSFIEKNMFPLDPEASNGKMSLILPNWKTLSSDIDRNFFIEVEGSLKKYYIKDDDTFIGNSSYALEDGEYFNIDVSGTMNRFYTQSEKDHAFIISEDVRQKAINLLGGDIYRTLEVSAPMASGIEYNYSLSSPRENFYFLKVILSSIETLPSDTGSFLLKNTRVRYELMDSKTSSGLNEINEYIKYKVNHRVFVLDDEDLMLNYIEQTSSAYLTQVDITFDSLKQNKSTPLLTRQIPWYILIYPTNRPEYNLFNGKSQINILEASGVVVRSARFRSSITPEFTVTNLNKFVTISTNGIEAVNVYGETDPQTRVMKLNISDPVFNSGYRKGITTLSAKNFTPVRKKTGLRVLKEIIESIESGYYLNLDGAGQTLTEHEVYGRMAFSDFNRLARLENFKEIRKKLRGGLVDGVKVIPTVNRSSQKVTLTSTTVTGVKNLDAIITITPLPPLPPIDPEVPL